MNTRAATTSNNVFNSDYDNETIDFNTIRYDTKRLFLDKNNDELFKNAKRGTFRYCSVASTSVISNNSVH